MSASRPTGAVFILRYGFWNTPLSLWLSYAITNDLITEAEIRLTTLHARMMTYLDHLIRSIEE
jgi:hypothetical protein